MFITSGIDRYCSCSCGIMVEVWRSATCQLGVHLWRMGIQNGTMLLCHTQFSILAIRRGHRIPTTLGIPSRTLYHWLRGRAAPPNKCINHLPRIQIVLESEFGGMRTNLLCKGIGGDASTETSCDWFLDFFYYLYGQVDCCGDGFEEEGTDWSEYGGDISGDSDADETVETSGEC